MNRYPPWVNLLVALVIFGGVLFALPNVFGDDPALQITREDGNPVTEITVSSISATLQQQEIEYFEPNIDEQAIVCLLYTSPSPRDKRQSRMPSSA